MSGPGPLAAELRTLEAAFTGSGVQEVRHIKTAPHEAHGNHLLADFHGVTTTLMTQPEAVEALLRESAQAAGAHILYSHCHSFGAGQGVTGVVLLAESHISIHTWPEVGFVAIDIFMCGAAAPQRALEVLRDAFAPISATSESVARGRRALNIAP